MSVIDARLVVDTKLDKKVWNDSWQNDSWQNDSLQNARMKRRKRGDNPTNTRETVKEKGQTETPF